MKVESENIDPAAQTVNVDPANKPKSFFAGRTFGTGANDKTFMTKEVMSALDKKDPSIRPENTLEKE
ncbi:MAG: hypothetical protein LBS22_04205 [Puniceicoccales bacterium]|jgi:hypothetical protein|nr:hypothetical protein [Puniceicoccales bacterium]